MMCLVWRQLLVHGSQPLSVAPDSISLWPLLHRRTLHSLYRHALRPESGTPSLFVAF